MISRGLDCLTFTRSQIKLRRNQIKFHTCKYSLNFSILWLTVKCYSEVSRSSPIKLGSGLTPRFYSLKGELTHWVNKAKDAWLIVGQLPIKAGWWNASLALGDFSFLTLFIHFKHKTIRWGFGLTPLFYSLEGELTHWVDNVWLIFGQLPIRDGWWDASLTLGDLSWSNKQNYFLSNTV